MSQPRRRAGTLGATLALTAVTAAAAPAAATAAPGGATTIDLNGAAAKALRGQQVRITAQRPARAGAKRVVLPVRAGTVASGARLHHRGAVILRSRVAGRTRTARLTAWETRIGPKRSTVTAKLGAKRIVVLTIAAPKRRIALDKRAGTAKLTGGAARLTPAGARALRRRLALRRLPAAQLGTVKVNARTGAAAPARPTEPGSGGGTPGPIKPTDPGAPRAPPIASEPPLLARPASATEITGARLTWWVRDSFVAYVAGGHTAPATGTTASDGATAQAPIRSSDHLCPDDPKPVHEIPYAFDFTFKHGWYDAATGVAGVYFSGAVAFKRLDHGIDMSASDPEVEINGSASRTIFRFDGGANTRLGNKRDPLTNLDVARAARTFDAATRTVTYGPVRGALVDGSANSFAGFYFPGDGYGCIQLSFSY